MKKMSQEKILKKLKNRNIRKSEIDNLIGNYIFNRYDLNELFKLLDNSEIYKSILLRAYRIERLQDFCDMKKVNINDVRIKKIIVKSLPKNLYKYKLDSYELSYICDILSFFKLYDEDTLERFSISVSVELYKRDKDNNVFEYILKSICYEAIEIFNELQIYTSYEKKCMLLDKILDYTNKTLTFLSLEDKLKEIKEKLSPYDFEYIRIKSLTDVNRYENVIVGFLYKDFLDTEKRKKHIDEIIKCKYTKVIYNLLFNSFINRTDEETDKLKKALENIKGEYYFYYLVITDVEFLVSKFGSYSAIAYFMENDNMFKDKDKKNGFLFDIKDKIEHELSMDPKTYSDEFKSPVNEKNKINRKKY